MSLFWQFSNYGKLKRMTPLQLLRICLENNMIEMPNISSLIDGKSYH